MQFPKIHPASTFAELKIVRDGSPLRIPREDFEGARLRVQNEADWRDWMATERAEIEHWMAHRADHTEWSAGWFHDFVSPKNGARLQWTPDEPTANSLVSLADESEHVALTPKLHGAWVYGFRQQNGKNMVRAARLFRLMREAKFAEWAASQLDFYAENYATWPDAETKPNSRLMWQSLSEAVLLVEHLNAARTLGAFASAPRKAKWVDLLFRVEAEILDETFQRIHNIATWQRAAAAQVALYAGDEAMWKREIDGEFGIRAQLREGVTSDYLWYEQSLGYNTYLISALQSLFIVAQMSGRGKELETEMLIAQNLMLAPLAMRFPSGHLPSPADGARNIISVGNLAAQYRLFPTALALEAAREARSWDTLLDPPEIVETQTALPPVFSRNMESSRMAILRNDFWQLFFHFGQLTQSHSQCEALNFEAFFEDVDVTHDAGTVGYGSPLYREYNRCGLSHNVPLCDGEGQEGWNPGILTNFNAENCTVNAAQPDYTPRVSAQRTLHLAGRRLIDNVIIETKDGSAHRLGFALQLQGEVKRALDASPVADFAAQRPVAFAYWQDVTSFQARDRAIFDLMCASPNGPRTFRVTVEFDGNFRVFQARTPDAPPHKRDSLLVETFASQATFRTVIEPL